MREVIKEGRDVNEAIELACTQLGVERGQINFEIIELPRTSFFGLVKKAAKVRVTVDEPEETKKRVEKPAPRPEQRQPQKPVAAMKPQPPRPTPPKPAPPKPVEKAPAAPAVTHAAPAAPAASARNVPAQAPIPAAPAQQKTFTQEKPREDAVAAQPREDNTRFVTMEETEGKARTACDYVKSVLMEMGVDAKLSVAQTENGIIVRLSGDGLGVVIGRRGETLDSLQYLTGLVANRAEGDYLRVTIDTGNYREKRERTLQQLAKKLSASAIRSGRSTMLEPMNPYERRIIHSTVSEIEGVSSSSVGEEPNRRVVISPANAKPRYNNNNRRGPVNNSGSGGSGAPRRPQGQSFGAGQGVKRPPRYNDNRAPSEFHERAPRPEMKPAGTPTSTALDREYAKELDNMPRAQAVPAPEVKERILREKPKDEAGNMPLYGKIDI